MLAPRKIQNLSLIGFMGTGKSSVGRLVADALHFTFLDTDHVIQARAGSTVREIFEREGEPAFREWEGRIVEELTRRTKTVISAGGGLPTNQANLDSLKSHSLVICLWASPENIFERVGSQTHRPLLNDPDPLGKIRRLLAEREPYYRQADVLVNTGLRPLREVVGQVIHHFRMAEEKMKAAVWQLARELGFDDCRVTTAQSPESAADFQRWLAQGRHGEMAYLQRNAHKRVDPQLVLPGARSIITLAVSYASDECRVTGDVGKKHGSDERRVASDGRETGAPLSGVIARYARYEDYHEVIGQRLELLAEFVNELGGAGTQSLWYVDTGPLLERDLAQRAGLGFVGKHTNLISRKLGNWFFLAEMLTTLELPPDSPEPNRCGSCTRCIAACPTDAITGPFQLDARRCISYLTIELKGSIPLEFRKAIGNRIYGCDDCLAVCPWNRFAQEGSLMKSRARTDLGTADLIELLSLDDESFKRRFVATPIFRAKRRGLLRNVCVALGNIGDETALAALENAVTDAEPLIAEHARWAIEQIVGRKKSRPSLKAAENLLA